MAAPKSKTLPETVRVGAIELRLRWLNGGRDASYEYHQNGLAVYLHACDNDFGTQWSAAAFIRNRYGEVELFEISARDHIDAARKADARLRAACAALGPLGLTE